MTRIRVVGTVDSKVVKALEDEVSRVQKKDISEEHFASSYSDVLQLVLEKGLGLSENRKKDFETVAVGSHFDVSINFESFGVEIKKRRRYEKSNARGNLTSPRKCPIWLPRSILESLRLIEGGCFEVAVRRIGLKEYNEKYRVSEFEER